MRVVRAFHSHRVGALDAAVSRRILVLRSSTRRSSIGSRTALGVICLNQGAYITFKYLPAPRTLSYDAFDAVLSVWPDSAEYLRFAFPGARVSIVDPAIDPAVFHPGSGLPPRQIAMMPRRRPRMPSTCCACWATA